MVELRVNHDATSGTVAGRKNAGPDLGGPLGNSKEIVTPLTEVHLEHFYPSPTQVLRIHHSMSHRVRIRHPGYHGQNTLFTLHARDGQNRDHAHYATVKAACSVITDNENKVWLSHSASSNTSLDIDADGLLPTGDYFLHVPQKDTSDDTPYPIVPNFRAWKFPHDAFPQLWQDASRRETNCS